MIYSTFQIGAAEADAYILSNYDDIDPKACRPCLVICPGGGYGFLANREGDLIARKFNSEGYSAVVLRYSVSPARFPQQLVELSRTVSYLRQHAEEWHLDKDKIIVAGFSAGGHLAASLGTMWQEEWLDEASGTSREERRPNYLILGYPVTSWDFAHKGTFFNLLGQGRHEEEYQRLSLEKKVTENMVPTFLWSTWEDATVPIENTLLFASALRAQHIVAEVHIYSWGEHGLGLANEEGISPKHPKANPRVARWVDDCVGWLGRICGER